MSTTPLKPFSVLYRNVAETPVRFTPQAYLVVTPALCSSRLLSQLTDDQARTLLALLTHISPNGTLQASVHELATDLAIPEAAARKRLKRLTEIKWIGAPLVHLVPRETSPDVYALSPLLIHHEEQELATAPEQPVLLGAGRRAVMAHSRRAYSRPRAEVERIVARQLGHHVPDHIAGEAATLWQELSDLGVPRDDIARLFDAYPIQQIKQQLAWLPYRNAKDPSRLIVAAIKDNYEAPVRCRVEDRSGEEVAEQVPPAAEDPVPLTAPNGERGDYAQ